MSGILQAALANLEQCPAWQHSGPTLCLTLVGSGYEDSAYQTNFQSVLEILSAVISKKVQLCVSGSGAVLSTTAVQKLSRALGARLSGLELKGCLLKQEFWPAVWAHLPGRQQLTLHDSLSQQISARDLVSFCSHAARPLQLKLGKNLTHQLGGGGSQWFEEHARVWGVPQVTVTKLDA
jgi:hypothetical protein